MLWFSDKKDLQYYNQTPGAPCYCEEMIYPSDMMLQGNIPAGAGTGTYTISIEVWSVDGNTIYEVATSYFDYYFFTNPVNKLHYFTARLKSFSPAMCAHKCFLIRVGITNAGDPNNFLFANWTERWCISDCCDTAKGIVVTQDGLVASPLVVTVPGTSVPAGALKTNDCGEPMLRLISQFDCYDAFTGDYYGQPDVVLSGAYIPFLKISSIKGRIVRRPREIKRQLSYNCRLQLSESTPQYLLEGFEYFPVWKMAEIENQLHANHIWVDDYTNYREYQFAGGTPFKQIHKCAELFKLETALQDCTQRQVFGCGDCATGVGYTGAMKLFAIPTAYNGGAFYNESKRLVAEDYDGLLTFMRSQSGITQVDDVDISSIDCELYKVFGISGTETLPSFIYYDSTSPANKIYGRVVQNADELCANAVMCTKPAMGEVVIEDVICTAPLLGLPVVSSIPAETVLVRSHGDWIADPELSNALVYRNQVVMNISSFNETIVAPPDSDMLVNYEIIGSVDAAARPQILVVLTNANNDTLPVGAYLSIDNKGLIRYSGSPTDINEDGATISFTNIVYTI